MFDCDTEFSGSVRTDRRERNECGQNRDKGIKHIEQVDSVQDALDSDEIQSRQLLVCTSVWLRPSSVSRRCFNSPMSAMTDIFPKQVPFEDGHLHPPTEPGLGVTFDESAFEELPAYEPWVDVGFRREDGSYRNWCLAVISLISKGGFVYLSGLPSDRRGQSSERRALRFCRLSVDTPGRESPRRSRGTAPGCVRGDGPSAGSERCPSWPVFGVSTLPGLKRLNIPLPGSETDSVLGARYGPVRGNIRN